MVDPTGLAGVLNDIINQSTASLKQNDDSGVVRPLMEKVKSVTKSGWHPSGKDGKKESWRGDFKGINQVVLYP